MQQQKQSGKQLAQDYIEVDLDVHVTYKDKVAQSVAERLLHGAIQEKCSINGNKETKIKINKTHYCKTLTTIKNSIEYFFHRDRQFFSNFLAYHKQTNHFYDVMKARLIEILKPSIDRSSGIVNIDCSNEIANPLKITLSKIFLTFTEEQSASVRKYMRNPGGVLSLKDYCMINLRQSPELVEQLTVKIGKSHNRFEQLDKELNSSFSEQEIEQRKIKEKEKVEGIFKS